MNRCATLSIIQIPAALFFGEMAVFAFLKHPLSKDFGFSETFLGHPRYIQAHSIPSSKWAKCWAASG